MKNWKGVQTMIKCGQITSGDAETPTCGKDICCYACENREGCEDACTYYEDSPEKASECEDRIDEDTSLATMQTEAAAVIDSIAALTIQKKQLEDQEKEMRSKLMAAMEKYGVKSFENEKVKFTYVAPTTRTTIDSKALKADLPDVAAKYSKTSNVSASVKITVK